MAEPGLRVLWSWSRCRPGEHGCPWGPRKVCGHHGHLDSGGCRYSRCLPHPRPGGLHGGGGHNRQERRTPDSDHRIRGTWLPGHRCQGYALLSSCLSSSPVAAGGCLGPQGAPGPPLGAGEEQTCRSSQDLVTSAAPASLPGPRRLGKTPASSKWKDPCWPHSPALPNFWQFLRKTSCPSPVHVQPLSPQGPSPLSARTVSALRPVNTLLACCPKALDL